MSVFCFRILARRNLLAFVVAACLASGIVFSGCSSSSDGSKESVATDTAASSTEATSEASTPTSTTQQKEGVIGEPIQVTTKYGELEITVDGFELSTEMRDRYTSFNENAIKEGKTIGLLLMKVNNISYSDEYNEGFVALEPEVHPIDADGISVDSLSESYDYGEYKGAAGAFFPCETGQAKRVALFYIVDDSLDSITIQVGETTVPINLEPSTASASDAAETDMKEESETGTSSAIESESTAIAPASTETANTSASGAYSVADYCDKMQKLYNTLTECMDTSHDAEAAGDVAAAQEAKKRSDDAYSEVLRYKAPPEAKDVDIKMRAAAANMNLLAAFYEDATIAKSEGNMTLYEDDMVEIQSVINDINNDSQALSTALEELTNSYK